MFATKSKRQIMSPVLHLWDVMLLAQPFEFDSTKSPRDTTRQFSQLVCYPRLIFDVGRATNFKRVGENAYQFDIRHKRYLGRGAYALSARAIGIIAHDNATGATYIIGRVRQGAFYLYALVFMTLFVLTSFTLVPVSILFLPFALLMLAVIQMHWRYLLADRRRLFDDIVSALQEHEVDGGELQPIQHP
jgi:hypothetical protein